MNDHKNHALVLSQSLLTKLVEAATNKEKSPPDTFKEAKQVLKRIHEALHTPETPSAAIEALKAVRPFIWQVAQDTGTNGASKMLAHLDAALVDVNTVWIPVSERSPGIGERCWITDGDNVIDGTYMRQKKQRKYRFYVSVGFRLSDVTESTTHWMPYRTPTPPITIPK